MKKFALFCVSVAVAFSLNACNAMLARISGKDGFQSEFSSNALSQNTGEFSPNVSNSATISELLRIQKKWQNTPYRLGGTSVGGADCSGFIQTAFREHFHSKIPRTTVAQFQSGVGVQKSALKAGDIVFFRTGQGPNGLHTGIYVVGDEFIHLSTKGGVKKVSMNSSYWKGKFIGARRYLR